MWSGAEFQCNEETHSPLRADIGNNSIRWPRWYRFIAFKCRNWIEKKKNKIIDFGSLFQPLILSSCRGHASVTQLDETGLHNLSPPVAYNPISHSIIQWHATYKLRLNPSSIEFQRSVKLDSILIAEIVALTNSKCWTLINRTSTVGIHRASNTNKTVDRISSCRHVLVVVSQTSSTGNPLTRPIVFSCQIMGNWFSLFRIDEDVDSVSKQVWRQLISSSGESPTCQKTADYLSSLLASIRRSEAVKMVRQYRAVSSIPIPAILRQDELMQKWWMSFFFGADVVISFSDTFPHRFSLTFWVIFFFWFFLLSCLAVVDAHRCRFSVHIFNVPIE